MKKRKGIQMALSLFLLCSMILSGCGGKDNGSSGQTSSGADSGSQAQNTEKEKPVKLIWYTISGPQKDQDKVMAEVNKYTREKINAEIDLRLIDWGDYSQKMQVIAASGEPFDIAFTSSWAFNYVESARKGYFYELDDLLDKYGQGIKKALNPAFLEGSKVNGHNYAIPTNKELPAQAVWRFNKTLADKYNLDVSKATTLESLEPMLKTVKENEPDVYPIPSNISPYLPFDFALEGIPVGVPIDTKDFKVINVWDTPETKQVFDTMHKYYQAGYLPPDVATKQGNEHEKTGKWLLDKQHTVPFADIQWSDSLGYKVVSTPIHKPIVFNWSVTGSMQAISAKTKHPEKAMEFLNLLNTDEHLRNLINYGLEGVHYKKLSEDTFEPIPDSGYSMPSFTLGNMFLLYKLKDDPKDKWEQYQKFNESATNAPLLGFQFDPTNVMTEIANVKNAVDEYGPALNTGSVDPAKVLPQAIEKLKAQGIDKIIAECQKQLDEWKAQNNK
ncbi:ABC transporter substrate-binding protein [Paenibacillus donghaensis]|uniref:ABC transporter substrate-binding protein n=1 Tax=Paenibacillus donghaensis TaxID=414771 RepID=UPI0018839886|nr:ABC transporter substrate-binding protein [Paenibacillus donghaensis]MBE9914453.1 ABC transporter substrate-binding protein [Paenibacillus donghaensis]